MHVPKAHERFTSGPEIPSLNLISRPPTCDSGTGVLVLTGDRFI